MRKQTRPTKSQVKRFAAQCGISIGSHDAPIYPTVEQLQQFGKACVADVAAEADIIPECVTENEIKSGRYPWTYAADFIRGCTETLQLSRSNAANIHHAVAKVIGIDEKELANKLANAALAKHSKGE